MPGANHEQRAQEQHHDRGGHLPHPLTRAAADRHTSSDSANTKNATSGSENSTEHGFWGVPHDEGAGCSVDGDVGDEGSGEAEVVDGEGDSEGEGSEVGDSVTVDVGSDVGSDVVATTGTNCDGLAHVVDGRNITQNPALRTTARALSIRAAQRVVDAAHIRSPQGGAAP